MHAIMELVLDEVRGAWRFRWRAILCAWCVAIVGWLVVLAIPNTYEATARVFVDPITSLKPVIQGLAVEQDVDNQLSLVRQSMLSEPQLEKVVKDVGLAPQLVSGQELAGLVAGLRSRIQLEVLSTPNNRGEQPLPSKLYVLHYKDSDRDRSVKVVDTLLNNFVEETLGGKREGSQRAEEFLQQQIADYELRLTDAESKLAEFKKANVGLVPGGDQQGDYFTRLQNEMDAASTARTALGTAIARREALLRQLRGEASVAATGVSVSVPGQAGAGAVGGDTLSRIRDTQARLEDLLLGFTEKHPDVIALRETLTQLQARRESELAALRRGDANAAAVTGASANPVYQSIQVALNQAEVEIASIRNQIGDRERRIGNLRTMLDTMPQVEAEYARLTRDYSVTRAQYTALAERLEKARIGEDAIERGVVNFDIIDPPAAAFSPVSPPRSLLLVGVFVLALVAGAGLAYVFNLFDPVFSSVRGLAAATGLPILGSVSLMKPDEESGRNLELMRVVAAAGCLFVALTAVLAASGHIAPIGAWL